MASTDYTCMNPQEQSHVKATQANKPLLEQHLLEQASCAALTAHSVGNAPEKPDKVIPCRPKLSLSTKATPGEFKVCLKMNTTDGDDKTCVVSPPAVFSHFSAIVRERCNKHEVVIINHEEDKKATVVASLALGTASRHVAWISGTALVCTTDQGNLQLLQFDKSSCLKLHRDKLAVHNAPVCAFAVNPWKPEEFVTAGLDKKLCLGDCELGKLVHTLELPAGILGVKWSPYNLGCCVSCMLDSSKLLIYDIRTKMTAPIVTVALPTQSPRAHEHLSDYDLLIGDTEGKLSHIDVRASKQPKAIGIADPTVRSVCQVDQSESKVLIGGKGGVTVWHILHGQVQPWRAAIVDGTLRSALLPGDRVLGSALNGTMALYSDK
jgi:WD40 repeat protein